MQTFLPYPDIEKSVQSLDRQRLGKQRIEALGIFYSLTVPKYPWRNHAAVRMWFGYESALVRYGIAACTEWANRGYKDNTANKLIVEYLEWCKLFDLENELVYTHVEMPSWWGDDRLHDSHKANLTRKLPDWYRPQWPEIEPIEGYWWPNGVLSGKTRNHYTDPKEQ